MFYLTTLSAVKFIHCRRQVKEMWECKALVDWEWRGRTQVLREDLVPVSTTNSTWIVLVWKCHAYVREQECLITLSSQAFWLSQQQTSTSYAQEADSQNSIRVPVAHDKPYRYAKIYNIVLKFSDYKRKLNSLRRLSCRSNIVSWIWYWYWALCVVTHVNKRTKRTCILCLLCFTFYDLYTLILCTTD
jgi:hypothetical protein